MKVLIIAGTQHRAEEILSEMIENCSQFNMKIKRRNVVEFQNGDVLMADSAREGIRGFKADKIYCTLEVQDNFINCILRPMLMYSWIPRDEQIVRV